MRALDYFAGTGWGVACQWLGIREDGIDIATEVRETRTANGMPTIGTDVWEDLLRPYIDHSKYRLKLYSPPCQPFSQAGHKHGRVIDPSLYLVDNARELIKRTSTMDPRAALVFTPLMDILNTEPEYVAMEQVPAVLPVWESYAAAMRAMGYSVATGIMCAEQFGVSQTRRRAILMARRDGAPVSLPTPTHSKYHRTAPDLTDPGTIPWVSMAEVLGWGRNSQPAPTYCASGKGGSGIEWGSNGVRLGLRQQSLTPLWDPKPNVEPGSNDAIRVSVREASMLQSYPADFVWCGTQTKQYRQIGNATPPLMAKAILRALLKRVRVST